MKCSGTRLPSATLQLITRWSIFFCQSISNNRLQCNYSQIHLTDCGKRGLLIVISAPILVQAYCLIYVNDPNRLLFEHL